MNKKILAFLLAVLLLFSAVSPVMADENRSSAVGVYTDSTQARNVLGELLTTAVGILQSPEFGAHPADVCERFEIAFGKANEVYYRPDSTLQELNAQIESLQSAIDEVSKPVVSENAAYYLSSAISSAEVTVGPEIDYTPESYAVYAQALAEAKRMQTQGKTDAQVIAAADDLKNAVNSLESVAPAVKYAREYLRSVINSAYFILSGDVKYTAQSIKDLEDAIASAEAVYYDTGATAGTLYYEADKITNTINYMEEIEISEEVKKYLEEAIAKADTQVGDEEDYTPESWRVFFDAYQQAKRVQSIGDSDEEFTSAADALNEAIDALESVDSDLIAARAVLLDVINSAHRILASGEKYTEESALRLQNAIDSANEMYIKEDATEEELTAEVTSLENAMNMMEVVTVSEEVRAYLAGVIALADSEVLEEKDYTPESWEVFIKAYDEALRVQAKGESDEEFISAADALGEAMEKLESADAELQKARGELMSLIEYTVTEDVYTAQSLARFESAKSEATAVYNDENATYEDIQAQIKSMEDAISGLELIPETSPFKEKLALWIASADEVENSDVFSAEVWAQFADSYENAKRVYDTEASDEVFIQASESLRNAMDSLMIQAREALMGQLQRPVDDGVNYTDESLENLSNAISKGWKVYNNKDAELAEVLNGVKQISEAFDLLEVVTVSLVAIQTLTNVIEKADAKFPQKDSYTEESWQNFKTAYESAVITLHFGKSDAEFYLCAQTLQSAMDALEVKPEPPASPDEIFVLLGDADGNGKVNIKDATYVQKCVAGITNLSDNGKYTADSNADGKINVKDATEIQKFLAGLNANENIGTYIPVEL